MVKYICPLIIATFTISCLHAQAPELTQLDQNLTELAGRIKEVHQATLQEKYTYIRQTLQKAADIFKYVLLLRSTKAAEDNPFVALVREFSDPTKIDQLTLNAHVNNIGNRVWEIGNLLQESKHDAAHKYLDRIFSIFENLRDKQLWPSEQLFNIVKSPFKKIQEQLASTMAALED